MLVKLSFKGQEGARLVKRLGPSRRLEARNATATFWVPNARVWGAALWEGPSTVAPVKRERPGRVWSRRVGSRAGILFSAIRNRCGALGRP